MKHSGCFFARVVRFRRRSVVRCVPVQFSQSVRSQDANRTASLTPAFQSGDAGDPTEDALAVCCDSVTSFSPVQTPQSHPSERHVTGRCEQEEPSSEQVAAGEEEDEEGGAAGGDIGRTRRRGFVFATMKTRIEHLSLRCTALYAPSIEHLNGAGQPNLGWTHE